MTYRKSSRHPKNWRASKRNQLFCNERNFRVLEKMFYYYNKIKLAVKEAEEERTTYLSATNYEGGGGHSTGSISDPTQRLAFRDIEDIKKVVIKAEKGDKDVVDRPKEWIKVVDETLKFFQENDNLVKEVLYRRYLKNEGFPSTCIDLEISTNKYYRARDCGLQYARECAIQLGLLTAFSSK